MKTDISVMDRVELARWKTAQVWERDHWIRNHKALGHYGKNFIWQFLSWFGVVEKYRGDDRNYWWARHFENYAFLPANVENALEVGCGPYTNMRLIRKVCAAKHLFLSDPLIRTYVGFKMTFVRDMYLGGGCSLDDHPIEELPFADGYFDLCVMVNVLDHVQDAGKCMRNLIRLLKPGGYFVIGQDLTSGQDLEKIPSGVQIGHPVTVNEDWFSAFLNDSLETCFRKVLRSEEGWAPEFHYGTLLYAGRKR